MTDNGINNIRGVCHRPLCNEALDVINLTKQLLEIKKKELTLEELKNKHLECLLNQKEAELAKLKEEIDTPYLLINADAKLTAGIRDAIKTQKPVIVPDNEGIVIRIDKASTRAEAFNEFAERLDDYVVEAELTDDPQTKVRILFADYIEKVKREMAGEG